MSRNLLALAVAASLAVPAVAAAEDTGPSVYGRLHLSVGVLDNGEDAELNIGSHSSRLGFKGSHDLGEGLQGIYQIEATVNADEGGGTFANRNTFAGLKGGFGTVRIGNIDTPVKNIASAIDLFGDQVGDIDNIGKQVYGRHFDERAKNSIAYTSPDFGGFTFDALYSTNIEANANDPDTDTDTFAAAVTYRDGPLYASLGYQMYGEDAGNGDDRPQAVRLGGYYDIDALRLIGMVQATTDDPALEDTVAYAIGARYSFGKYALKAQFAGIDADASESNAYMLAIGGDYKLAKNLTAYAVYAQVDNDDLQTATPYGDTTDSDFVPLVGGETTAGLSVGMIYNF